MNYLKNGEFAWNKKIQGGILSAYFYGYLTTQVSRKAIKITNEIKGIFILFLLVLKDCGGIFITQIRSQNSLGSCYFSRIYFDHNHTVCSSMAFLGLDCLSIFDWCCSCNKSNLIQNFLLIHFHDYFNSGFILACHVNLMGTLFIQLCSFEAHLKLKKHLAIFRSFNRVVGPHQPKEADWLASLTQELKSET